MFICFDFVELILLVDSLIYLCCFTPSPLHVSVCFSSYFIDFFLRVYLLQNPDVAHMEFEEYSAALSKS